MKKNLIILCVSVLLALGLTWAYQNLPSTTIPQNIGENSQNTDEDNISNTLIAPDLTISPITFDSKENIKNQAWNVLEKYLSFAKDKNIEGLKNISYQLSESCLQYNESAENKTDCDNKMNTVYFFGEGLQKQDFLNVWSDKKQVILSTDFIWDENGEMMSRSKAIVYFVIDDAGIIKLLSFNPAKGSFINKGSADKKELEERLIIYTEDKDEDGKEDYLENCLSSTQSGSCLKTDPAKKDSDANGWWDGVEILFR